MRLCVPLVLCVGMVSFAGCGGSGSDGMTGPEPVVTVTVNLAASTLNVGESTQATATLKDKSGATLAGRQVTWSSSNTSVASVSSQGAVTAVAAGTTQITALSEGKTGQAPLTVNAGGNPQVSGLTVSQNGVPADLNQVAGDITLDFTLDLPPGYGGTLIVTLDTVEFLREAVSAPAVATRIIAGSTADADVVSSHHVAVLETGATTTIVGTDRIEELPKFHNDMDLFAKLAVVPALGGIPDFEQSFKIRGMNPWHAHLIVQFDDTPVTGLDGKMYIGGSGRAAPIFALYGGESVTGFEIAIVPKATVYGPATLDDIVQVYVRNDLDIFAFDSPPVERSNLTIVLERFSVIPDGEVWPQLLTEVTTSSSTMSGFASTPQQELESRSSRPPGVKYVQTHSVPDNLLGETGTHFVADVVPFHVDNVGPVLITGSPVHTYHDRNLTVDEAALDALFGLGATSSQLGAPFGPGDFADPADFLAALRGRLAALLSVDRSRLGDVTGIDANYAEYHVAPVAMQDHLFDPQFRLGASYQPPETNGQRTLVGGVVLRDGRGNESGWYLTTSIGNPYKADGGMSDPSGFGMDRALFGWTTQQGTFDINTLPRQLTWNQSSFTITAPYSFSASNAVAGVPDGWLAGRGSLNGLPAFGAGTAHDQYQVLPSTGGTNGGTASFYLPGTLLLMKDVVGLVNPQGRYDFDFIAHDAAGLPLGDRPLPRRRTIIWDYLSPTNVTLGPWNGGPFPGGPFDVVIGAKDNIGLSKAWVGTQFDIPSAEFYGGSAYLPTQAVDVPDPLTTPVTDLSMSVQGTMPVGLWFYNPATGAINVGDFHRSKAGMVQFRDMAWNLSPVVFSPFVNTEPVPAMEFLAAAWADVPSDIWCPGICAGGGMSSIDVNFRYLDTRPGGTPVIGRAEWFALPVGGGGWVYPLGEATTFTETPNGGGRYIEFSKTLDLKKYCGPKGSLLVLPVGFAANGQWLLKPTNFFPVTVLTPNLFSNKCNSLPRPRIY